MSNILTLIVSLSLLFHSVLTLSVLLTSSEPYCFEVMVKRHFVVKANYMISGLNEDEIEFRAYEEDGKQVFALDRKREQEIIITEEDKD